MSSSNSKVFENLDFEYNSNTENVYFTNDDIVASCGDISLTFPELSDKIREKPLLLRNIFENQLTRKKAVEKLLFEEIWLAQTKLHGLDTLSMVKTEINHRQQHYLIQNFFSDQKSDAHIPYLNKLSPKMNISLDTTIFRQLGIAIDLSDLAEHLSIAENKQRILYLTALRGSVLRECWMEIPGKRLDNLKNHPSFTQNPSFFDKITVLQSPEIDWADDYGTRIRGYLYPPVTGEYRFWIAGDNCCELWLSQDCDEINKKMIASVPESTVTYIPGETRIWELYKYDEQQSQEITLKASQRYYFEALQKEDKDFDNFAVAWQIPGSESPEIIQGNYLSPFLKKL